MGRLLEELEQVGFGCFHIIPLKTSGDLLALGLSPGPEIGRVLKAVYERQLDGAVTNLDEARAEARRVLDTRSYPC